MSDEKFDVIIIGSGFGGLVCGYILAKNGYKVAVLEKNAQIGGCLQTFSRFGVKFDTGMHYVGALDDGQLINRFFRYLNLLGTVKLSKLDADGYDRFSIDGKHYRFANGYDQFVDALAEQFPDNRADLQRYVAHLQTVAGYSDVLNLRPSIQKMSLNMDYYATSFSHFLETMTANETLQNVLAGNLPLYVGVKGVTPMYVPAILCHSYIQSAYRFVGGSDQIAASLAQSIRDFGGEIFTKSEVTAMICDDVRVVSVQLADGNELFAKQFISDIHPQALLPMLNTKLLRRTYRERLLNAKNTISNFSVYIKFKENRVKYNNYNFYFHRSGDVWKSLQQQPKADVSSYWFMHQCHEENPTFAQSAKLISCMDFREVERWAGTKVGRRGDDYEAFKQQTAEKLLRSLADSFPGILEEIDAYATSSPLTYNDYTATAAGSMYGILHDATEPVKTLVSQRTKIPNLFMTGQNTYAHGILGTAVGALVTCSEFLDINDIINDINHTI